MINWLKHLLGKGEQRQVQSELPKINSGERWRLCARNGDPWGQKPYPPVTVLDVRDGWVRYDMGREPFRDERKEICDFVRMYKLVTPNSGVTSTKPSDNTRQADLFDNTDAQTSDANSAASSEARQS